MSLFFSYKKHINNTLKMLKKYLKIKEMAKNGYFIYLKSS